MNERIQELMKQAGIDVELLRTYPGGWPRDDLLVLEDFAKLILEDISGLLDQLYHRVPLEQAAVLLTLDENIKDHFYKVNHEVNT